MAVTAVVQWLLVLALLVGHSQGQSEGVTGLVDNNTLTEWGTPTLVLSQTAERQFLFPGLRFRCSGNVTKWIVGAAFRDMVSRHPALGIYRDRPGGGFADRVGATVLEQSNYIPSRVYEFTPDPPLPFQTNDCLGIYLPPDGDLRVRPLHRQVTDGPASRNYIPSNDDITETTEAGVVAFNLNRDLNAETDRLPLVAVEIESDDPDSADCTRDFVSRDLLELLAHTLRRPSNLQIVFVSYNFTSDGNITSWTVAATWQGAAGRNSFPELQIWRRRSGDTYDRVAITELTATAESPNELYSGTIEPPLQFQSGDVLGMHIPRNEDVNVGTRLLVYFGRDAGSTYEFRMTNTPLNTITLGVETNNDRPLLALEIMPSPTPATTPPTTATTSEETTGSTTTATTSEETTGSTDGTTGSLPTSASPPTTAVTSASPPTTAVTSASPPTELLPVIAIAVGASVGGVAVGAVTVLIIVAAVACAKKKKDQNPTDRSVDAINMTATAEDAYDYPLHEPAAVATKRNEAYATTAITTEQNEAYATTRGGDTATDEYEYI